MDDKIDTPKIFIYEPDHSSPGIVKIFSYEPGCSSSGNVDLPSHVTPRIRNKRRIRVVPLFAITMAVVLFGFLFFDKILPKSKGTFTTPTLVLAATPILILTNTPTPVPTVTPIPALTNTPVRVPTATPTSVSALIRITDESKEGYRYTIQAGDQIGNIAREVYGDLNLYDKICAFNQITDCNNVPVGTVIELPLREVLMSSPVPPTVTPAQ